MLEELPPSLRTLVRELSRLPTIGEKSAIRLAYHLVSHPNGLAGSISKAISDAASTIKFCNTCFHLSEGERCAICSNSSRDQTVLCVVEKPMDVIACERSGEFRGLYHVLHGLWSPIKGVSPEQIKLSELQARVQEGAFKEVILATSSTVEGDATALYITRMLSPFGVGVSRLAQGMPKGGEVEYADDFTLSRAFIGRSRLE